ncbi:MAG: flagellar biosynthesis protein FlgM [Kiritimatiellae bacterium]|nr:flagellar biosynthesis protein FlgM [Kiritimatiellia bacterium]
MMNECKRNKWTGGQLLAFSGLDGPTDFHHGLTARTSFAAPGLDIVLPGRGRVHFPVDPSRGVFITGDAFRLGEGADAVTGAFLDTHHLLISGPCSVENSEKGLTCLQEGTRTLLGTSVEFQPDLLAADIDRAFEERCRWLNQQTLPPETDPAARRTLLQGLSLMKSQVYSPAGKIRHRWTTPDRWPHRAMWLWDSAFHAIGWRHLDPDMARDALSAVLDTQAADGFIAHRMDPNRLSAITQPPVLALGVKAVHDLHPAPDWIADVYPKLAAYLKWDFANRDRDGAGLVEWEIEGNPHCRSGESGMDNSPRFDAATRMDAVDFNAFLARECEIMAEFARELGRTEDANRWAEHHQRLCRLIRERLWSADLNFFVDYDIEKNAPSDVLACSGFLPLLCGAASPEQAAKLVEHLRNPDTFGTPFPVPSVAACQARNLGKDMWRGPVWINLNWLIAEGLDRYGYTGPAEDLRQQTRAEIQRHCETYGTFFEFYDAQRETDPPRLHRKGACAPEESPYKQVFHDFGWTATLYVDLCFRAGTVAISGL